jgi:hypothetical protein
MTNIIKCELCFNNLYINEINYNNYDKKNHILLCELCSNSKIFFSKKECYNLIINNDELKSIRYLYLEHIKNKIYLFDNEDIKKIIRQKKINDEDKKKINKSFNKIKKEKLIDKRKIELYNALTENKLVFKEIGNCYSYIHHGKPSITDVINSELYKTNIKCKRRHILNQHLSKKNIPMYEDSKYSYEYINNIGYRSIEETVRMLETEHFLKSKTNYLKLLETYNDVDATEIALQSYYTNNNKNLPQSIEDNIKIIFN